MTYGRWPSVQLARGGWWARLDAPGWFMTRGPYCWRWQAKLAFPIQRWNWHGGG